MNSRPVWGYRDRLSQFQRADYLKKEEYEEEEKETTCQKIDYLVIAMAQKY